MGDERVLDRLERPRRIGRQRGVGLPKDGESVVVKAEEDMRPVLLRAQRDVHVAPARAFSAEPPPELVERDLKAPTVTRIGEFEGGGEAGDPPSQHRDLDRPSRCPRHGGPHLRCRFFHRQFLEFSTYSIFSS